TALLVNLQFRGHTQLFHLSPCSINTDEDGSGYSYLFYLSPSLSLSPSLYLSLSRSLSLCYTLTPALGLYLPCTPPLSLSISPALYPTPSLPRHSPSLSLPLSLPP